MNSGPQQLDFHLAQFWELPALPCACMERLRTGAEQCVGGVVVSIAAYQAVDPGSILSYLI